jgi:signal transduction histidine kinase
LKRSYYKIRIIAAFCLITITIVILMSRFSYLFVRNLYLDQLGEQVSTITQMLSGQLDESYVKLLDLGKPTMETEEYFRNTFRRNLPPSAQYEIFIFDNSLDIIVHPDSTVKTGTYDPRLLLNKKEINQLKINNAIASLPFKGNDGKWYLWGFCRLTQASWLAVRESASRMASLDELSNLFWYIGIAGTLLSLIVALFLARSITKPLDKLVGFSKELGKGNFRTQIPEGMKGEIRELADSMNSMRNEISEHQKQKENMLAQIAHEIRNPLGGIELLAGLTREDLAKEDKKYDYLDRILKEINRLKLLIVSYLNFSRPSPAIPEPVNVKEIVQEISEIYRKRLQDKKISFFEDTADGIILFDPAQLKQVLINLISNSIESVPSEGNISISYEKNGLNNLISVCDDGPGIDEKDINNIFSPFFTSGKNGTGLGLAICKKLCEENKARLTVKNNETKGCTFSITKEI